MCLQEKWKKAQIISQKNVTSHRLSRGGYDLLEKKIMEEKLKRQTKFDSGELIYPPSPPNRHGKWKLARTKAGVK